MPQTTKRQKNVLIIGATRGIGQAWVNYFLNQNKLEVDNLNVVNPPFNIFVTCRGLKHDQFDQFKIDSLDLRIRKCFHVIEDVDVGDDSFVDSLKLSNLPNDLNLVIFNSGIAIFDDISSVSSANLLKQYNINSVGVIRVAQALKSRFLNSELQNKFLITSSIAGSHTLYEKEPIEFRQNFGYRMSKSALNMAGQILSDQLKNHNVIVGLVHPGTVRTDMTKDFPDVQGLFINPDQSVESMVKIVNQMSVSNSGKMWHVDGYIMPW